MRMDVSVCVGAQVRQQWRQQICCQNAAATAVTSPFLPWEDYAKNASESGRGRPGSAFPGSRGMSEAD